MDTNEKLLVCFDCGSLYGKAGRPTAYMAKEDWKVARCGLCDSIQHVANIKLFGGYGYKHVIHTKSSLYHKTPKTRIPHARNKRVRASR